jgi:hypothetical protein
MLFDLEVKYQAMKWDENDKLVDDGNASATRIISDMYMPDVTTAARVGNALAEGFSRQSKENGYYNLKVSIEIYKNGQKIVEAWPAATQFVALERN